MERKSNRQVFKKIQFEGIRKADEIILLESNDDIVTDDKNNFKFLAKSSAYINDNDKMCFDT